MRRIGGFSLVEVMVAGTIFSIAVAGVFASLAAVKSPVQTSDRSLIAANCGQQVLEYLRAKVDTRDWSTGDLTLGVHVPTVALTGCTGYAFSYTVTDPGGGSTARKVALSVTW